MTAPSTAPTTPDGRPVVLAARGVRKSFSGVEVLHGVDFTLRRGEVHGLVGQNGAGKSTLVKIIDGAYTGDAGEIEVNGTPLTRSGPGEARKLGIAMVFQEFSLIPSMPVGQNILLSREPKGRTGLIDDRETRRRARSALARIGADIDPDRLVGDLPVGSRQLVEIAKAISQDLSILILDEPTSSLAVAEIRALADAIGRLTAEGISVIFISHHLNEIVDLCDHVTVLRDGNVTLSAPTADVTLSTMIESMLGRSLESALAYRPHDVDRAGQPLLRVAGLRNRRLHDISFELHAGEILGVAGLLGSGKSELLRAIFGIDRLDAGTIEVRGRRVPIGAPSDALRAGIALVPEDRARAGLVREHSVGHNILMASWSRFARGGIVNDRAASRAAGSLVEQLGIRTSGLQQQVRTLSGGNQQKVVVARNLSIAPRVMLLDDPTVGVDVGSKREILMEVRELAARGTGVVLVSSELEELSGLADRVLVMRAGAARTMLDRAGGELTEEVLSRAVQE
ncbi:MAG TPA: sugar ABC transporter ATP-binding protein [Candidatus Limnocylindrales bacterium]